MHPTIAEPQYVVLSDRVVTVDGVGLVTRERDPMTEAEARDRLLARDRRDSEPELAQGAAEALPEQGRGGQSRSSSRSDMFVRVAENIASAERAWGADDARVAEVAADFYDLMTSLEFLPNSPTLMNAGRELQQLSACFVLPVEDSMESIFGAVRDTALIHKSGGGTGFSFSRLRPAGDSVRSTQGVSSGPVSFMRVFNQATEAVKQGGTRRGANMGVLRIDHPDILDFIKCKADGDFANFNISVALTEEFMEAVKAGHDVRPVQPARQGGRRTARRARGLRPHHRDGVGHRATPASSSSTASTATIRRRSSARSSPRTPAASSRCCPYEACNLGSVNLSKMVRLAETGTDVDWDRLADVVHRGIRFLDDVIEVNHYPLPQIGELARGNRKVGLGVMGWADMLIKLGIGLRLRRGGGARREGHGLHRRRGQVGVPQAGRGARRVPELRGLGLRHARGRPDPQRDGHHDRADRHALDHRELLVRRRAAVRRELRAHRHGQRPARRGQPAVRGDRRQARLLQPRAHGADRRSRLGARDRRGSG